MQSVVFYMVNHSVEYMGLCPCTINSQATNTLEWPLDEPCMPSLF